MFEQCGIANDQKTGSRRDERSSTYSVGRETITYFTDLVWQTKLKTLALVTIGRCSNWFDSKSFWILPKVTSPLVNRDATSLPAVVGHLHLVEQLLDFSPLWIRESYPWLLTLVWEMVGLDHSISQLRRRTDHQFFFLVKETHMNWVERIAVATSVVNRAERILA